MALNAPRVPGRRPRQPLKAIAVGALVGALLAWWIGSGLPGILVYAMLAGTLAYLVQEGLRVLRVTGRDAERTWADGAGGDRRQPGTEHERAQERRSS